jgi:hypothetical protein
MDLSIVSIILAFISGYLACLSLGFDYGREYGKKECAKTHKVEEE